jgi:hypothetical protein
VTCRWCHSFCPICNARAYSFHKLSFLFSLGQKDPSDGKKLTNGHDLSEPDDPASPVNPVIGGIWNQDLFFLSNASPTPGSDPAPKKGCKVMKPR